MTLIEILSPFAGHVNVQIKKYRSKKEEINST